MKNITVFGNLGKDFESRKTQNGDTVHKTTLAVNDGKGENGEYKTQWFDIEIWGKRGDYVAANAGKGSKLVVSGELKVREYQGKTYLSIRVDSFSIASKVEPKQLHEQVQNSVPDFDDCPF